MTKKRGTAMKRGLALAVVVLLAVSCILLSQRIYDAGKITGLWYSAEDDSQYQFKNGQIFCSESGIVLTEGEHFSGAYFIAKDKVTLFLTGGEDTTPITTLYLVYANGQERLCALEDGSEIWFYRERDK